MKSFLRSKLFLSLIALILIVVGPFTLFLRHQVVQAATGDWSTFLFDNSRSGFNGAETVINQQTAPKLTVHWTHVAGASISDEPVAANGLLYWGDWSGVEHASSLSDGSDVWTTNLGTSTANCAPQPHGVASTSTIATEVIGGVSTPVDYVGVGPMRRSMPSMPTRERSSGRRSSARKRGPISGVRLRSTMAVSTSGWLRSTIVRWYGQEYSSWMPSAGPSKIRSTQFPGVVSAAVCGVRPLSIPL